ncbi:MAG: hypothetical protein QOG51_241 [Verrucomicrobiota bacterium]|jgi:hypothetical protein
MRDDNPVRSGPELVSVATGTWLRTEEIIRPLIVFVHGFTAHGRYLKKHATLVQQSNYCAAYFNYDSYVGIDIAAGKLAARLNYHAKAISSHGLVFIAHSMGGLVTRFCVSKSLGALGNHVKGVVLLGTPSQGTLNNGWMLPRLLDAGDLLAGLSPYLRLPMCRAAKQLTMCDPDGLIRNLNSEQMGKPAQCPTLTIAGGLKFIELGDKPKHWVNHACNMMIQKVLGPGPNDGLVPEASVNLNRVLGSTSGHNHKADYEDYSITNHSALAGNQEVGYVTLDFIKKVAP